MTNLKDKLSANVRRAKASQEPEQTPAAAEPAAADNPAPTKPAAQPTSANHVKESGTALFPDRIWPD